jgi:hypothetical protein
VSPARGAALPASATCTSAARLARSGSAGGPLPRYRRAQRSTAPGSGRSRPCTPTSGRCRSRAGRQQRQQRHQRRRRRGLLEEVRRQFWWPRATAGTGPRRCQCHLC